jgi:hypothetical protein
VKRGLAFSAWVWLGPELACRVVLHVVEVADGGEHDTVLVEDRVVVEQPLLVTADLDRWVEHPADPLTDEGLDAAFRRRGLGRAPLLELDDDRVLGARARAAGQHRVEALARVAELVFEDDAVVLELRLVDQHRQRLEAVLPGVELVAARLMPHDRDVFVLQLLRDPMHLGIGHELLGRPGVELHCRDGPFAQVLWPQTV